MATILMLPDEVINCITSDFLSLRHICIILMSHRRFVRAIKKYMPKKRPNTEGLLAASQSLFARLAFRERGVGHPKNLFVRNKTEFTGYSASSALSALRIQPRTEYSSIFINYMQLVKVNHPLVRKISEEPRIWLIINGRWLIKSAFGPSFGFWRILWAVEL